MKFLLAWLCLCSRLPALTVSWDDPAGLSVSNYTILWGPSNGVWTASATVPRDIHSWAVSDDAGPVWVIVVARFTDGQLSSSAPICAWLKTPSLAPPAAWVSGKGFYRLESSTNAISWAPIATNWRAAGPRQWFRLVYRP